MNKSRIAAVAVGAVVGLGVANGTTAEAAVTVVMSGLDNPRGLAFSPNGALYVAEAGRGGAGPCVVNGAGENRCYGPTGAITRLWKGVQQRVVEGLPSHAVYGHPIFPNGSSASGPNDISFQGTGGAYVTLGLGGGPQFQDDYGAAGELMGTVLHVAASGQWRMVADVASFEFAANPDVRFHDSNPFGILAEPGGRYVADAGANALFRVASNGSVETVAVFPRVPHPGFPPGPPLAEAVPTTVARGPDGALYVGQLTGFPFASGVASVYRVVPGQAPVVHCTGFTTILDIAFGQQGEMYVVENASGNALPPFPANSGRLLRVEDDCSRSTVHAPLDRPTSVVIGPDGSIYVTNHGVSAGIGEVLKITP
jgi:hypothetical protein